MKFQGTFAGAASGSLSGVTASHNRGGQYLRKRAIPTNPNTVRQQEVRGVFASMVNNWTTLLTPTQRESWRVFAANTPQVDSLGQPLILTGQQAYVKANTVRAQVGLPLVASAPASFDNGPGVALIATANSDIPYRFGIDSGSLATNFIFQGSAPDDGDLLIFLGLPQNESRRFYKGPYQLAFTFDVTSTDTNVVVSSALTLNASEYVPALGLFMPVRARITYDDGRLSPVYQSIAEVVSDPE